MPGFNYAFHGACLRSNVRMEGLPEAADSPNADICLQLNADPGQGGRQASRAVLPWSVPGMDCHYERALPMTLHVSSQLPEDEVQRLLCATLLPTMLQDTGALVLRGAAVDSPLGALLLVGGAMAGKSTAAAALSGQGFPIISDDVIVLRLAGSEPQVAEGPEWIHLWPDGESLGRTVGDALGPVRRGLAKQRYRRPPCRGEVSRTGDRSGRRFAVAGVCVLNPSDVSRSSAVPVSAQTLLAALSDFQKTPVFPVGDAARKAQFRTLCALARLPRPKVVQRPSESPLSPDYGIELRELLELGGAS